MRKILIVNSHYYPEEPGGAEKSVRALAQTLTQAGHQVLVFATSSSGGASDRDGEIQVERIERPHLRSLLRFAPGPLRKLAWHYRDQFNSRAANEFRDCVARFQPDVVHTNNLPGLSVSLWQVASDLDIPVVHTLRDYYLLCPNTAMFKNDQNCPPARCSACVLLTKSRIQATQKVACVVGNSDYILREHTSRGLFSNAQKRVVFNAFKEVGQHAARRGRIDNRQIVFGFLGRVHPSKGVRELVSAVVELWREHPSICLKIAGAGEPEFIQELKRTAGEAPVAFEGVVDAVGFLKGIDFAVVPSMWAEPLARSAFEPQALGIPVIGAATGGTPEAIDHGQNGWLYDPLEPSGLLDGLRCAIECRDGDYAKRSEHALTKSRQFSQEHLLAGYEEAYLASIEYRSAISAGEEPKNVVA